MRPQWFSLAINAGGVHFLAYDGNGNVSALVASIGGTNSANYSYSPFGQLLQVSGPLAKINRVRFSTKVEDDESDYVYYGYRYYSPSAGRWLSRDPIEERGGVGLYCMSANDGLNAVDRFGLLPLKAIRDEVYALNKELNSIRCCCEGKVNVAISISGIAAGHIVKENAKLSVTGSNECFQVLKYYWWNCFAAQKEAWLNYGVDINGDWQEYGWHQGGASDTRMHLGGPGNDPQDSNHWNWWALVIYKYCDSKNFYRASLRFSNQEQWTWKQKDGPWGDPQPGNSTDP